jgi:hypothetical protein
MSREPPKPVEKTQRMAGERRGRSGEGAAWPSYKGIRGWDGSKGERESEGAREPFVDPKVK